MKSHDQQQNPPLNINSVLQRAISKAGSFPAFVKRLLEDLCPLNTTRGNDFHARTQANCLHCQNLHKCYQGSRTTYTIACCRHFLQFLNPYHRKKWPYQNFWKQYQNIIINDLSLLSLPPNKLLIPRPQESQLPKSTQHSRAVARKARTEKPPTSIYYKKRWWTEEHFRCLTELSEAERTRIRGKLNI